MTSDLQQLVNAFDAGALVRSVSGSVSLVDVARAVGHLNYRGAPATSKRCDSGGLAQSASAPAMAGPLRAGAPLLVDALSSQSTRDVIWAGSSRA